MTLQIGFLIFPRFQLLDLAGPFDAFAALPDVEQHLIWKDRSPVTATCGWRLDPTTTLQECPPLDVLCDEAEDYARRLSDAGVPVVYRCYETLPHGFTLLASASPAAARALAEIAHDVDLVLSRGER